MAVVSSLLSTFGPLYMKEYTALEDKIKTCEQECYHIKEALYESDIICMKDPMFTVNMWYSMFINTGSIVDDEFFNDPDDVNHLRTLRELRCARISSLKKAQDNIDHLKTKIAIIILNQEKFQKEAIDLILETSWLKEIVCELCGHIGIPIMLKYPCYKAKPEQCLTKTSSLCETCACDLQGSSNIFVNMTAIRMIDFYLDSENKEFMKHYNVTLNPIKCSVCTMAFARLSALHIHMHDVHSNVFRITNTSENESDESEDKSEIKSEDELKDE